MPTVAFRALGPIAKGKLFNDRAVRRAVIEALSDFEKIALRAAKTIDQSFETPFEWKFFANRLFVAAMEARVWTDDPRFRWLDEGTRPHVIRPKREGGVLVFPSQFTPKTSPQRLESRPGGSSGELVFTKVVHHPGTKARNYSRQLRLLLDNRFRQMLDDAFDRAAPDAFGGG